MFNLSVKGNLETAGAVRTVMVNERTLPWMAWPDTVLPNVDSANEIPLGKDPSEEKVLTHQR